MPFLHHSNVCPMMPRIRSRRSGSPSGFQPSCLLVNTTPFTPFPMGSYLPAPFLGLSSRK